MMKASTLNVHYVNCFASLNCTFFHLKEKFCDTLGLLDHMILTKLYYCQPQITTHGQIRYDVVHTIIDENVSQLLTWKSQFAFSMMTKLYVKLTRCIEKIVLLIIATITSSFSTNQDLINSTEAIIYCR